MSDDAKIYELYAENAHAQNEQPKMKVNKYGVKEWRLHGELHRDGAPAIERANGSKTWWLHSKLHREDGAAVELADGTKSWYLHGAYYADVNQWAQAVLMMRNEPHDAEAVQKYVRMILTKDDLL
jgi:hypothetical protein